MNVETIRNYCLGKPYVTEEMPFGDDTLVFKVHGKIFTLMNLEGDLRLNLKCEPSKAIELREKFPAVQPGYHMNKQHWNTIALDGSVPDSLVFDWIDDSFALVVAGLPARLRQLLL